MATQQIKYSVQSDQFAGDLHTPVSLYLKLRDLYEKSALLESSDYHSGENSRSYIALAPLAEITINNGVVKVTLPGDNGYEEQITEQYGIAEAITKFMANFEVENSGEESFGVYGYTAFDAVKYLEQIGVESNSPKDNDAADVHYVLYRHSLIFDHFHHTLTLRSLAGAGEDITAEVSRIVAAIESRNFSAFGFKRVGEVSSPIEDEDYRAMVRQGIKHCLRGDVFQIVLSRRFIQKFTGDDFAVYRKLRGINPSPYLFYFDFGGLRIFGSSPETHCKVENGRATIDPIAGTAFRTGDMTEDRKRAEALRQDPKENAEHVMLVDLARNDLSRNATNVEVEFYKQTQYYSHVIHLVSRVSGEMKGDRTPLKTFMDTFPAGTLSGSPKVRALQLINDLEPHNRGIYGGAIGYIGFDGSINHAITIRTFVSRNGALEFQAGAGIVALSDPERELQETNNKLGALSKAIKEDIE
ncbi:MAG: anthranilate synthase component I family protein [Rikenellaceae bacterium]